MRFNKEAIMLSAATGLIIGTIAINQRKKPDDTLSISQTGADSPLFMEKFDHCRNLVDAVLNEASIIQATVGNQESPEPVTCRQLESHQNRRIRAKEICSSLQQNLPKYCTDRPDMITQTQKELEKLDNLPFEVEVDCSLDTPIRKLNCDEEAEPDGAGKKPK